MAWWREAVFYQIYPRSFQDGNGDGVGDLIGILSRLDHLEWLGIDCIWLSPVFVSPQVDFGYDISNYCQIDPLFGTMADMEQLIDAVHRRGMKIILDGVFNHSSDRHSWFIDSSLRRNDKDDWYIWSDRPNNWASAFGGSAWTWNKKRGQYYYHSFAPQQPDLNWRNSSLREAIYDVMRFWLDKGIDGFRLDVFNAYLKSKSLEDNPARTDLLGRLGGLFYSYIGQEHVYDRDHPEIKNVLQEMRAVADEYDAVLVGETLDERFLYEKAADYVGEQQLQLTFHFGILHSKWKEIPVRFIQLSEQFDHPSIVLSNHDFPRQSARWGEQEEKRRLMALLSVTWKGTPFIYYGEEIGLSEVRIARRDIVDPPGKKYWPFYKGRDGARTVMQWNTEEWAGFSTKQPWLSGMNTLERTVQGQKQDPNSLLWCYQQLLCLRRQYLSLHKGTIQPQSTEKIFSFIRSYENERCRILCNWTSSVQRIEQAGWTLIFSTAIKTRKNELSPLEGQIWIKTENSDGRKI